MMNSVFAGFEKKMFEIKQSYDHILKLGTEHAHLQVCTLRYTHCPCVLRRMYALEKKG